MRSKRKRKNGRGGKGVAGGAGRGRPATAAHRSGGVKGGASRRRRAGVKPLAPELREAAFAALRRTFAANLRRIRKARGFKCYGAARELGVSASTWSRWEAGERFPTPPLLAAIAALLQTPVAEFFAAVCAESE